MKVIMNAVYKKLEPFLYCAPLFITAIIMSLHFFIGTDIRPNALYTAINVILYVILFLFSAHELFKMFRQEQRTRKYIVYVGLILLFWVIGFAMALIRFNFYSGILKQFKNFILIVPTAAIVGALTALKRKEEDFFDKAEKLTLIALAPALNCIVALFMNVYMSDKRVIGLTDYMHVAYGYMPFIFILTIQILRRRTGVIGFKSLRASNLFRILFIVLAWTTIIGSASRGPVVCVGVFFCVLAVYVCFIRKFKLLIKIIPICLLLIVQFVFFSVYTPTGFDRFSRVKEFADSLFNDEMIVGKSDPKNVIKKDEFIEIPDDYAIQLEKSGSSETKWLIGSSSFKERSKIYKVVFEEVLAKPFTGLGPMGITAKYGSYPHNLFLEILSDWGFVLGGIIIIAIIACFIRLVICSRRDSQMGFLLVFLLGVAFYMMLSGTFWAQPILMFCLAYGICYSPQKKDFLDQPES